MIEHFKTAMTTKYADFKTRSTRSEYWYFFLVYVILSAVLLIPSFGSLMAGLDPENLEAASSGPGTLPLVFLGIYFLLALAMLIPSLAVGVRRLHDIGRSGWWYLIAFIPFGSIVLLIMACLESQPGANKWGPNPHGLASGDDVAGHLVKEDLI